MKNGLIVLSLALNLLLAFYAYRAWDSRQEIDAVKPVEVIEADCNEQLSETLDNWMLWDRQRRDSLLNEYPATPDNIVVYGDSMVATGDWAAMFPDVPIRNFGRNGDTAEQALARIGPVIEAKPKAAFIMLGTNDISMGFEPQVSYEAIAEILARFRTESPATTVYLQSVLPKTAKDQQVLEAFNRELEKLAQEYGATYLDLYAPFLAANGAIDRKYSNDNLHLYGAGFRLWQSLLEPHMAIYRQSH